MTRALAAALGLGVAALLAAAGCGGGDQGFAPFPAPEVSGTDLNPDSPSHGETRSLSAERGEVVLLLFVGYACEVCRQEFAQLRALYEGWRGEGIGAERLELWVVGYPIAGHQVGEFADGADVPCLIDGATGEESIFARYGAEVDELFVIDGQGVARHFLHLLATPLDAEANRARLDGWVRGLLAE